MKALFDASHASASSTETVRLKRNDAVSWSANSAPSGKGDGVVAVKRRPGLLDRARPLPSSSSTPGSRSRSSSATQSCSRSLVVQMTPSRPPGRSTRAISGTARAGSSQCQAVDTNTASALASGSGMASPVPSRTSTSGDRRASTSRIRGSGSTATTRAARPSSSLVNRPVPAARSTATSHPSGNQPVQRRRRRTRPHPIVAFRHAPERDCLFFFKSHRHLF